MKGNYIRFAVIACVALMVVACSNDVIDESSLTEASKSSTLIVRTRTSSEATSSTSSDEVSYPVAIYVFDENDACVDLQAIEEEETDVTFHLSPGTYSICSIGGASEENYSLPSADEATPTSVIELVEGMGYTELQTASNDLTIADDETSTLTITLNRVVMLIQTITMSNIPDDVTAVDVAFAPLYDDLILNGKFNSTNSTYSVSLTQSTEETGLWELEEETYLFEASGAATITVKLTRDEGITSYAYSCADQLEANYKINIDGTYNDEVEITGTLTAEAWAGERTITFELGDSDDITITDTTSDETTGATSSSVPSVGDMYKGAFVYKVVDNGDNTYDVYVCSASETGISGTSDETSTKASCAEAVEEMISKEEISTGWALATSAEFEYIFNNRNELNNLINELDEVTIFGGATSAYYYAVYEDDDYYALNMYNCKINSAYGWEPSEYRPLYVRIFNVIKFI